MTVDLDRQIRAYCQQLDDAQAAVTHTEIRERTGELHVIGGGRVPHPSRRRRWVAVVLALVVIAVVVADVQLLPIGNRVVEPGDMPPTTIDPPQGASSTALSTPTSAPGTTVATLPDRGLPGTRPNSRTGEYGWTSGVGTGGWLHRVIEGPPGVTRQTQLSFRVDEDCFTGNPGAKPTAVTVAGLDALHLEPYDGFEGYWSTSNPSGGETTAAYALPVGDLTLCVYLRWDAATTPEELRSARDVVESIRAVPFQDTGIRINFTLPPGWDTG